MQPPVSLTWANLDVKGLGELDAMRGFPTDFQNTVANIRKSLKIMINRVNFDSLFNAFRGNSF